MTKRSWNILELVDRFNSNNLEFSISNKTLSKMLECSEDTIRANVRTLREKDYVNLSFAPTQTGIKRILTILPAGKVINQHNPYPPME